MQPGRVPLSRVRPLAGTAAGRTRMARKIAAVGVDAGAEQPAQSVSQTQATPRREALQAARDGAENSQVRCRRAARPCSIPYVPVVGAGRAPYQTDNQVRPACFPTGGRVLYGLVEAERRVGACAREPTTGWRRPSALGKTPRFVSTDCDGHHMRHISPRRDVVGGRTSLFKRLRLLPRKDAP